MADETIRLTFQATTSDLQVASTRLEVVKAELRDLQRVMETGLPGWELAGSRIKALTAEKELLTGKVDKLTEKYRVQIDQTTKAATNFTSFGGSVSRVGLGVNALAQGMEDLQYGVGGAMNNLGQAAMLFGTGGMLVAGITLAGVAVNQLYRNWDTLANAMGARVAIPPPDLSSLEGINRKAKEVNEELSKLRERKFVTTEEAGRYAELVAEERALKKEAEARQKIEELKKLRTQQEEETAKAFVESLRGAGAEGVLKKLEQVFVDSAAGRLGLDPNDPVNQPALDAARRLGHRQFTQMVTALDKGNQEVYDQLAGLADAVYGPGSEFGKKLRHFSPVEVQRRALEHVIVVAENKAAMEDLERKRKDAENLTRQGAEIEADMFRDMADQIPKTIGDKLRDAVLAARAKGQDFQGQMAAQTKLIEAEIARLFPAFAAFPDAIKRIVNEVKGRAVDQVEETIQNLKDVEHLTEQEALRRIQQDEIKRRDEARQRLAQDEFQQMARMAANTARQFGGRVAPEEQEAFAQDMQRYLATLGLTPEQQVRAGKLLNQPNNLRQFPRLVNTMMGAGGLNESQAVRAALEALEQSSGQLIDPFRATMNAVNGLMRIHHQNLNQQAQMQAMVGQVLGAVNQLQWQANMLEQNQGRLGANARALQMWGR